MHLRIKVLDNLGCGLSVASLCSKLEISYDELCSLAQEDAEVYNELKRWYPRYDFLAEKKVEKQVEVPVNDVVEDKPLKTKRKSRKTKEKPEEDLEG